MLQFVRSCRKVHSPVHAKCRPQEIGQDLRGSFSALMLRMVFLSCRAASTDLPPSIWALAERSVAGLR